MVFQAAGFVFTCSGKNTKDNRSSQATPTATDVKQKRTWNMRVGPGNVEKGTFRVLPLVNKRKNKIERKEKKTRGKKKAQASTTD